METNLYITLEPERGKPITLARVRDRELLASAALIAVQEAESIAEEVALQDKILGVLHRQEACRLKQALELAVPEITAGGCRACVM
jgi:hypothetical protein